MGSDDESEGSRDRERRARSGSKDDKMDADGGKDDGEDRERIQKVIEVDKDDAAFVLGRGGSTKRKIARVAGAEIELDEHALTITISGFKDQCLHAIDYIDFIRQQRVGPVTINLDSTRNDFSAFTVPGDCIGFVMGRNGQTLRSMEEEWGVLMFFAKTSDARPTENADDEQLCIFGPLAARRGAELKTMSAVEHKHPGYCVSSQGELRSQERVAGDEDRDGWGVESMPLTDDCFSYALGSQGSTRRKLAAASGCIIEYVGRRACLQSPRGRGPLRPVVARRRRRRRDRLGAFLVLGRQETLQRLPVLVAQPVAAADARRREAVRRADLRQLEVVQHRRRRGARAPRLPLAPWLLRRAPRRRRRGLGDGRDRPRRRDGEQETSQVREVRPEDALRERDVLFRLFDGLAVDGRRRREPRGLAVAAAF